MRPGTNYGHADRLHYGNGKNAAKLQLRTSLNSFTVGGMQSAAITVDQAFELARTYHGYGQLPAAEGLYRQVLKCSPLHTEAIYLLGVVAWKYLRHEEAIELFQRAFASNPRFTDALNCLACVFMELGEIAKAIPPLERALAITPDFADAHCNLSTAYHLTGAFEKGWREYEWRDRRPGFRGARFDVVGNRWTGGPAENQTILVYIEQGIGDTIQFLRYLPILQERSRARIVFACHLELVSLVRSHPINDCEIIPSAKPGEYFAAPAFDFQTPMLSLPLALGLFDPLPMPAPYLSANPDLRAQWRTRMGARAGMRVGLVWSGSPAHGRDAERSVAPNELRPLLKTAGAQFYSIQLETRGALPPDLSALGVIDAAEHIADFSDTAALLAELDLIITVDTAVAHLAGAMGRPVWLLLPFLPDWRWGMSGEDTPWYPTMRLFRQQFARDWDEVIQRVAAELHAFTTV